MASTLRSIYRTRTGPRRLWMVVLFLVAAIPAITALRLPLTVSSYTKDFYNAVLKLPPGSVVVFGNTFEVPPVEARDIYRAVILTLASRNLKAIFLNFEAGGVAASEFIVSYSKVESLYGWRYGIDYVIFPYLSGQEVAMAAAATDFYSAYSKDIRGTPIENIPIMQNVRSFRDIKLAIAQYGIFTFGDMYVRQWPVKYPNVTLLIIGQYYGIAGYYGKNVMGNIDNTAPAFAEYEFLSGFPGEEQTKTESVNTQAFLVMGMMIGGAILSVYKRTQKVSAEGGSQ